MRVYPTKYVDFVGERLETGSDLPAPIYMKEYDRLRISTIESINQIYFSSFIALGLGVI
jgi:hypothetical protein